MSRKWMVAAALAAAGAIAPTAPALAAGHSDQAFVAAPGQAGVPAALQVPADNHLVVSLHVIQGVQVYACTKGAWALQEPDADMGVTSRPIVLYTAGPSGSRPWMAAPCGACPWPAPTAPAPSPNCSSKR